MPTRLPERSMPQDRPAPVAPRLSQRPEAGQSAEARTDLALVAGALVAGLAVALAVLWRSLV